MVPSKKIRLIFSDKPSHDWLSQREQPIRLLIKKDNTYLKDKSYQKDKLVVISPQLYKRNPIYEIDNQFTHLLHCFISHYFIFQHSSYSYFIIKFIQHTGFWTCSLLFCPQRVNLSLIWPSILYMATVTACL